MEYCAIYSHYLNWNEVAEKLKTTCNEKQYSFEISMLSPLRNSIKIYDKDRNEKLVLNSRQKEYPGYQLSEPTDKITKNLLGMYNYIKLIDIEEDQRGIKDKLLYKIASINLEIGVVADPVFSKTGIQSTVVFLVTNLLDGIIFSGNNSLFKLENASNAFFDKEGDLILDSNGRSIVKNLNVIIESKYQEWPN